MRRVRPALVSSPRAARLFGRDRVLARIRQALAEGAPVTLVGEPGVGKTELALHVARAANDRLTFVDLSSAHEPGDVLALVAHALGVRVGVEPMSTLRAALAARAAMLVLHRAERAGEEARALVVAVSGTCSVVTTSRTPLELPDEHVVEIEPLREAGVELFLERAEHRAEPSTRDAIRHVVDLCGGLPFAIELAAAAQRSAHRVADELESRVDRDRPLRDVIEWALDDLEQESRLAVAQAAVFEAPFGLAAFEAVVRLPGDVLGKAVARGLLARAPDAAKLVVHPYVRAVAMETLSDAERLEVLRRHAAYVASSAERSRADLLAAFEVELLGDRPEVLVRLIDALVPELIRQGSIERAEALVEAAGAVLRSGLSVARAYLAEARGQPSVSCDDRLLAAEIALRRDDAHGALTLVSELPTVSVRALRATGDAHRRLGSPVAALGAYRGGIELARGLEDAKGAAELQVRLAGVELDLGAPERAQPHLTAAIGVLASVGADRTLAIGLATLADLLLEEGDETGVDSLLIEARLHARRAGALDVLARIDVLTAARALGLAQVDHVPTLLAAELEAPGTWGDLARGLDAVLRARLDEREAAAELLPNGPSSAPLLGALELAEARRARVRQEDDAPFTKRARARLEAEGPSLTEVRIARRVLARMLDTAARFVVHRDGAWFSNDGVVVSLERRANLRRLLAVLLRRRIEAPGQNVPSSELHAAGWPGERLSSRVLEDRLHTAMQTMRDLGLRALLLHEFTHESGWRLLAEVPLDVA